MRGKFYKFERLRDGRGRTSRAGRVKTGGQGQSPRFAGARRAARAESIHE